MGTCDYCGLEEASLFPPVQLRESFGLLMEAYYEDAEGVSLIRALRDDWGLFHDEMTDATAQELLADVLGDREFVGSTFSPIAVDDSVSFERWEVLRAELMHQNRWFLGAPLDEERLRYLLSLLIAPENLFEVPWYRARLLGYEDSFDLEAMSAPPKHLAGHGRANPAGIPYLYLGSTAQTAIAEVRPHTGHRACVATFEFSGDLRIVDLRDPARLVSPFLEEDAEQIARLRSGIPFLQQLGEELTRPVLPDSAAYEYTPSQYLCEFIKKAGYDGVLYRSSVGDGMNLALFEPIHATGGVVIQVVKSVTVVLADDPDTEGSTAAVTRLRESRGSSG